MTLFVAELRKIFPQVKPRTIKMADSAQLVVARRPKFSGLRTGQLSSSHGPRVSFASWSGSGVHVTRPSISRLPCCLQRQLSGIRQHIANGDKRTSRSKPELLSCPLNNRRSQSRDKMPDIRSFFAPKGGAAAPKPAPAKKEEPTKGKRGMLCPSSRYITAY